VKQVMCVSQVIQNFIDSKKLERTTLMRLVIHTWIRKIYVVTFR